MPIIDRVNIFQSYTSRGSETVEAWIYSKSGVLGRYASPSGASTGAHEAPMFPNNSIRDALRVSIDLIKALEGYEYSEQEELDRYIRDFDGSKMYSRIGSALSISISVAGADLASNELGVPLFYWLSNGHANTIPLPLGNVLGGGKHALNKSIDIQEILVFPYRAKAYREAYNAILLVHRKVGEELSKRDRCFSGGRNDEGAWTTSLSDEEALQLVSECIDKVYDETGLKIGLGVDIAASTLWDRDTSHYIYPRMGKYLSREDQITYISELVDKYDLKYIEDPLEENDFNGFAELVKSIGNKAMVVGDDLLTTNPSRIKLALELGSCSGIIIKPNQIGDLTGSWKATYMAGKGGMSIIVSHRSGETLYSHLAHVAVAYGAKLFKCGVIGGERIIKHIELMRIEEEYGGLKLVSLYI